MITKSALMILLLMNCVSVKVKPIEKQVLSKEKSQILEGNLIYIGNPDYIPKFIINKASSNNLIVYEHTISYEPTDPSDFLVLFNPLIIFGFPIENHRVIKKGFLSHENHSKKIESEVIVSQYRILYNTPDYSEMRKIGLIEFKRNIEFQFLNKKIDGEE